MMNRHGFTLIELMTVVVIIGVLAALAVPRFMVGSHQAKIKEADIFLKHVYQAHLTWTAQKSPPTTDLSDLEQVGYSAPLHMEFYVLPGANAYGLPLCLASRQPAAWPNRQISVTGEFSDC
jgi:prepilin-type N-terminal cleavage/methylation domain-containing protein